MAIEGFDHFTMRTPDFEQVKDFFVEVIGLAVGPRPPFRVPGYWLYAQDRALLHLIGTADAGSAPGPGLRRTVDHVAFRVTDYQEARARFVARGIPFEENAVPGQGERQIFVPGPGGLTIELVFRAQGVL